MEVDIRYELRVTGPRPYKDPQSPRSYISFISFFHINVQGQTQTRPAATKMLDLFRDSPVGQCLRSLTQNRVAAFPEQISNFKLPEVFTLAKESGRTATSDDGGTDDTDETPVASEALERDDPEENAAIERSANASGSMKRDLSPLKGGIKFISWNSPTDPDNPYNWSSIKKGWISLVILLYTFTVYIGSSLYTASVPDIVQIFDVSDVAASLGLSLYVIGYGIGPLLFSPLSEIPAVGRNAPYIITFFVFVVLCVPTTLINNFGGLLALRFLLGFFGSPCLATGGASYGDFYGARAMPYVIALWGGGATLGPVRASPADSSSLFSLGVRLIS